MRMRTHHLIVFLICLYLGFYALTGDVFVRPDLNDIGFHLERSLDPFTELTSDYYAPVFHLMMWGLSRFMPVELAFSIFLPFWFVIVIPSCFTFMVYGFYYDRDFKLRDLRMLYLFGSYITIFMVFTGTYAQAVFMAFLFLAVGLMFYINNTLDAYSRRIKHFDLLMAVLVGLFTHTVGGIFLLVIYFIFLLQRRNYIALVVVCLLVVGLFYHADFLITKVTHIISTFQHFTYSKGELLRVGLFFINPVLLISVLKGWSILRGKVYGRNLWLLTAICLLAIGMALVDSELRPLLIAQSLSLVFICDLWKDSKWVRGLLIGWQGAGFIFYLALFMLIQFWIGW